MNLYVIPSWYPSETNPYYGIFIREQVEMMTNLRPSWKIGVSLWGQGDDLKLIWAKDHVKNLSKLTRHLKDEEQSRSSENITTLYSPALTWSKKLFQGNIRNIIRSNERNFKQYIDQQGKPDLLTAQAAYPGALIGQYLSSKYKIPYHVHIHMGGFLFENLLKDLGSMKVNFLNAINHASLRSCVSEFQKQSLEGHISGLDVIHNPVDTNFFQLAKEKGDGIVAVGRLESEKGFDRLVEAVESVDIKVRIIGDGSLGHDLKALVTKFNLNDQIQLLGRADRNQVRDAIQQSKFLVVPSNYETFGMVMLEAMSCGKPVVSTRCGGPEEIVEDETGILCDPSINGLRLGIKQMMDTYDSFQAEKIRQRTIDKFSPESWISVLEAYFKSIL